MKVLQEAPDFVNNGLNWLFEGNVEEMFLKQFGSLWS
jgi:hypothetical protein